MYNEDGETCYMLAVPGSGVTVLNLNHEINLFGSCTNVYTTEVLCYPSIQDEPTQLKVEKDDGWGVNLVIGVLVTAVFAGLAVCTGGAAAVILAGAALGSAAVTAGATYSDIKSGHSRSIDEFALQLVTGAAIGATSAALVGEIVMILPAASAAAGVEASLIAGNTSVFTAVTVPQLATVGGSGVAAANVMIGLNEAFAIGSGTNVMLETVFDGDVAAYNTAAMMMSMLGVGIIQYGISNIALAPNKNKSSKNGVNLETKSESGKYAHNQNLDGLNEVRNHLTNDVDGLDFEPNKIMMNKIEEMLSNNQKLTGAYKDFYEHELTESILMKQGYGYNDAHNMALEIHNVQPQALYSPEIVQEYSKWFNKSDFQYWGISIKK